MTHDVRDPRTGRVERALAPPSDAELVAIVDRVRAAQPRWEAAGVRARADALRALAGELTRRRAVMVETLVADTGRLRETELEVDSVIASIERWCAAAPGLLAEPEPRSAAVPFVRIEQASVPFPLVGVISPWNFPLLLGMIDTLPALLAGSAVLLKPSEVTPRFVAPLMAAVSAVPLLREAFVAVEGAGETGAAVVDLVDAVCFTGSVATGLVVGAAAARNFIPAFLELGGKDPAIVLDGADLDRATSAILWGGTANAGQSCLSIERVYVAAPIHDAFVDLLVAKASKIGLAWPEPTSGAIGPLIDPEQATVIAAHLADAFARGATARTGGEVEQLGGGVWVRPTVLTHVDHSMTVMREETFGPVLPVMSFSDVDEAVRLAEDTAFGLSAAVFGPETEAIAVARRLHAGAVSINDAALTAIVHDAEKQAFGMSGIGASRMGPAALRRFTRRQALLVREPDGVDPWWYPELG